MKEKTPKLPVALRLPSQLVTELQRRAKLSGRSQAKIVESALDHYFAGPMAQEMKDVAEKIASTITPMKSYRRLTGGGDSHRKVGT